jgi:hypothetical protein
LSRKDELTPTQKLAKEAEKTRLVLPPEVILSSVEIETMNSLRVTEEVLQANRADPNLESEGTKAKEITAPWRLSDGLLLYNEKLIVPGGYNYLRTRLMRQIHDSTATAHPGRNKTIILLKQ